MKYKIISFCMIMVFLTSILISPQTIAVEEEQSADSNSDRLIDRFFESFFVWAHQGPIASGLLFPPLATSWKAQRFSEPPIFEIIPSSVNVNFLNKTSLEVGMADPTKEGFKDDYSMQLVAENEYYTFDLEFPEGIDEDAWFYSFSPGVLYPEQGKEIKSVLTIKSTQPDYKLPPTNLVFKINVTRHLVYGNLFFPPKDSQFNPALWFLSAITAGFWRYSGTEEVQCVEIGLMVRANRFHLASIKTFDTMRLKPNEVEVIPIEIQNLGSHEDSFNFRVKTDKSSDLMIASPSAVTLKSNEIKTVYIPVATPRMLNDPGTLHNIEVTAYSIYDETATFNNTAQVITKGIYVSEVNIFYSLPIIFLIIAIVLVLYYNRKKTLEKYCKKPRKPWEIAEEKKHLEKLKEKDKEKYEKELEMMRDEYDSALLWYKSYSNFILEKERKKRQKVKKKPEIKKPKTKKEKKKEKPKKPDKIDKTIKKDKKGFFSSIFEKEEKKVQKEKKPEKLKKEKPKKKEIEKPKIKREEPKKPSKEQLKKQRELDKIRKKQEKQKRKFGK